MPGDQTSADLIRETEHERLRALVAARLSWPTPSTATTTSSSPRTARPYRSRITSEASRRVTLSTLCSSQHPTLLSVSMGMPPRSATKRASRSGSPTSATPACSGTRTSTRRVMVAGRRSGRRQPGFPRGSTEPSRDAKVTDARCIQRNCLVPWPQVRIKRTSAEPPPRPNVYCVGRVAERSNAAVWKSVVGDALRRTEPENHAPQRTSPQHPESALA